MGDKAALDRAVAIRSLFDGKALVAGVKAGLAYLRSDPAYAIPAPPLAAWPANEAQQLGADLDRLRS